MRNNGGYRENTSSNIIITPCASPAAAVRAYEAARLPRVSRVHDFATSSCGLAELVEGAWLRLVGGADGVGEGARPLGRQERRDMFMEFGR